MEEKIDSTDETTELVIASNDLDSISSDGEGDVLADKQSEQTKASVQENLDQDENVAGTSDEQSELTKTSVQEMPEQNENVEGTADKQSEVIKSSVQEMPDRNKNVAGTASEQSEQSKSSVQGQRRNKNSAKV